MITHADRVVAAGWALDALQRLGHASLAEELRIEWRPFASRMGDALYVPRGVLVRHRGSFRFAEQRTVRVRLSSALWPRATRRDRYETVVHEVAHLVTAHEARQACAPAPSAHGAEWRAVMLRAGVTPERCCDNVSNEGLVRRVEVSCACPTRSKVTPYVAGRIAAGAAYSCRRCGSHVSVPEGTRPVAKKRSAKRAQRGW